MKLMEFPIKLLIENEAELGIVRGAFTQKIRENREQIDHLNAEIKSKEKDNSSYEKKLADLGQEEAPKSKASKANKARKAPEPIGTEIPTTLSGMSVVMQVALALKNLGKPSSTREIIDWLLMVDPTFLDRNGKSYDVYQKAMSATLVQKVKAGKLFTSAYDAASGFLKYSLLEWEEGDY